MYASGKGELVFENELPAVCAEPQLHLTSFGPDPSLFQYVVLQIRASQHLQSAICNFH
jgi:hypothetical protein